MVVNILICCFQDLFTIMRADEIIKIDRDTHTICYCAFDRLSDGRLHKNEGR